jgi:hypothetical protein
MTNKATEKLGILLRMTFEECSKAISAKKL